MTPRTLGQGSSLCPWCVGQGSEGHRFTIVSSQLMLSINMYAVRVSRVFSAYVPYNTPCSMLYSHLISIPILQVRKLRFWETKLVRLTWPVSLVSDHRATLGGGLVGAFHVKASFTGRVLAFYCLVRDYHKPGSFTQSPFMSFRVCRA